MRVMSPGLQAPMRFGSLPLSKEIVEQRWKSLLGKFNEADRRYLDSHKILNSRAIYIVASDEEQPVWRQKIAEACQGDPEYKAVDGKQYYGGVEIRFERPIQHWPLHSNFQI